MKTFFGVVLVTVCLVARTHSYPGIPQDTSDESGENKNKNVDTVLVLPPGSKNQFGRPILDIPDTSDTEDDSLEGFLMPDYFNPFRTNPFEGFLNRMQNVMNRLREQMAGILSRIPEQGVVWPWGKIPEGANTTSTTKVVDGHVVTINETTFTDGSDEHGTFIRVRIIDVKPENDTILITESKEEAETTTTPTTITEENSTTPARSVETVEDFDNEIPKTQVDTLNA